MFSLLASELIHEMNHQSLDSNDLWGLPLFSDTPLVTMG